MTAGRPGIDVVIDLLTRLAKGDYAARGDRTGLDEDFEAIVVGIEMLAEELDAQRGGSRPRCVPARPSWSWRATRPSRPRDSSRSSSPR